MTIAELKRMSDAELKTLLKSGSEPSYPKAINTEAESLDQIIRDFDEREISQTDREVLREDLINLK